MRRLYYIKLGIILIVCGLLYFFSTLNEESQELKKKLSRDAWNRKQEAQYQKWKKEARPLDIKEVKWHGVHFYDGKYQEGKYDAHKLN